MRLLRGFGELRSAELEPGHTQDSLCRRSREKVLGTRVSEFEDFIHIFLELLVLTFEHSDDIQLVFCAKPIKALIPCQYFWPYVDLDP